MIKLRQIKRALSRIKDAKVKAEFESLTTAEQIYLAAIERRGWRFDGNKIIAGEERGLDNETEIDYNKKKDSNVHFKSKNRRPRYRLYQETIGEFVCRI